MDKKFEKFFSLYQHQGGYANPNSNTNKKLKVSHVGNQFFENVCPPSQENPGLGHGPKRDVLEHTSPTPNPKRDVLEHTSPTQGVPDVVTVDNYMLEQQNHEDAIYLKRLQETNRFTEPMAKQLPKLTSVLNYMWKVAEKPQWLILAQQSIVNSRSLTYPNPPILSREYIKGFCRTPLPNSKEIACLNTVCESERLGGFRIRVLGIEDNRWCFLCHLHHTNCLFLESLNRQNDNERAKQIHFFAVMTGVEGEYKYEALLNSECNVQGLYAPFPRYNTHDFVQTVLPNGCKAWIESDSVVFRLSQTMSLNPIESSHITLVEQVRSSVQSNPTSFTTQSLRSP